MFFRINSTGNAEGERVSTDSQLRKQRQLRHAPAAMENDASQTGGSGGNRRGISIRETTRLTKTPVERAVELLSARRENNAQKFLSRHAGRVRNAKLDFEKRRYIKNNTTDGQMSKLINLLPAINESCSDDSSSSDDSGDGVISVRPHIFKKLNTNATDQMHTWNIKDVPAFPCILEARTALQRRHLDRLIFDECGCSEEECSQGCKDTLFDKLIHSRADYLCPPFPHQADDIFNVWATLGPDCEESPEKSQKTSPVEKPPRSNAVREYRTGPANIRRMKLRKLAPLIGRISPMFPGCFSLTSCAVKEYTLEDAINEATTMCLGWQADSQERERLYVNVRGSGPEAVIMVHGICMSGLFWTDGLLKYISPEMFRRFTFYCPDIVGYGRSIKLTPRDNYSRAEQTAALVRDVVNRYKLTSYHLVGHSFGCILLADLASRAPGLVKSMTFLAPSYFESSDKAFTTLTSVPTPVREIVVYPELGRVLIRILNFFKPYLAPIASKIIPVSELPELSVWDFFGISPDATLGTIYSIVHDRIDDSFRILEQEGIVIFVAHGDNDGVVPCAQARQLAQNYSNVILQMLPGLVHHFPASHSEISAEIVEHRLLRYSALSQERMSLTCTEYFDSFEQEFCLPAYTINHCSAP